MLLSKTFKVSTESDSVVDVEIEFACTEESIKDGRNPPSLTLRVISDGTEFNLVGWPIESMEELGEFIVSSCRELAKEIE